MKLVHQQMKNYLKLEESAMEERIRYVCSGILLIFSGTYVYVDS